MGKDFESMYAVVTGATSGMGAASAKMIAVRGLAGILIVGRDEERGETVRSACEAAGCKAFFPYSAKSPRLSNRTQSCQGAGLPYRDERQHQQEQK